MFALCAYNRRAWNGGSEKFPPRATGLAGAHSLWRCRMAAAVMTVILAAPAALPGNHPDLMRPLARGIPACCSIPFRECLVNEQAFGRRAGFVHGPARRLCRRA